MAGPQFQFRSRLLLVMPIACIACVVVGCQDEHPRPQATADRAPEVKFARFEAELLRRCEEASGLLVADDASGLDSTSVRTVIDPPSCIWHAPQTPEGNYTAEVTIVTRLVYASSSPVAPAAEGPSRLRPPGEIKLIPTEDEDQPGVPTNDSPVQRLGRQEEFRDTYDLVYREDRWQLVSSDLPESMRLLLNRALVAQ